MHLRFGRNQGLAVFIKWNKKRKKEEGRKEGKSRRGKNWRCKRERGRSLPLLYSLIICGVMLWVFAAIYALWTDAPSPFSYMQITHTHVHTHIYTHAHVRTRTHTHTHTHTYIYIYISSFPMRDSTYLGLGEKYSWIPTPPCIWLWYCDKIVVDLHNHKLIND